MHRTIRSLERYVLEFATIRLGHGSIKDNMVRKKLLFPDLLTTSNVRWINIEQNASYTKPSSKAENTYEKLMILIEKIKILRQSLYCFGNYAYIGHSYNFKPLHKGK